MSCFPFILYSVVAAISFQSQKEMSSYLETLFPSPLSFRTGCRKLFLVQFLGWWWWHLSSFLLLSPASAVLRQRAQNLLMKWDYLRNIMCGIWFPKGLMPYSDFSTLIPILKKIYYCILVHFRIDCFNMYQEWLRFLWEPVKPGSLAPSPGLWIMTRQLRNSCVVSLAISQRLGGGTGWCHKYPVPLCCSCHISL